MIAGQHRYFLAPVRVVLNPPPARNVFGGAGRVAQTTAWPHVFYRCPSWLSLPRPRAATHRRRPHNGRHRVRSCLNFRAGRTPRPSSRPPPAAEPATAHPFCFAGPFWPNVKTSRGGRAGGGRAPSWGLRSARPPPPPARLLRSATREGMSQGTYSGHTRRGVHPMGEKRGGLYHSVQPTVAQ